MEGDLPQSQPPSLRKRFQSTPSVGRATVQGRFGVLRGSISIHALRGEGDSPWPWRWKAWYFLNPRPPWGGRRPASERAAEAVIFQSTPSVGRATTQAHPAPSKTTYFNPRPPWGGRPRQGDSLSGRLAFQSTPSVGRATFVSQTNRLFGAFQSTPSVGRATKQTERACPCPTDFNPRPPWGGRHERSNQKHGTQHFNPRPPWGGRHSRRQEVRQSQKFQSTPSVGRATQNGGHC